MGWAGSGPDLNVGPRSLGAIGWAIGSGTIAMNADERHKRKAGRVSAHVDTRPAFRSVETRMVCVALDSRT